MFAAVAVVQPADATATNVVRSAGGIEAKHNRYDFFVVTNSQIFKNFQPFLGAQSVSKQQPQVLVTSPTPRPSSAGENVPSTKNYATYTKNPVRQNTYDADDRRPAPITATPKGTSTARHGSVADARQRSAVSSLMVTQKGTFLAIFDRFFVS